MPFDRLAPFIQEYIYQQAWTDMRPVQVEACRVLFETNAHLLISAGTASGKTEAAFLPVLTLLYEDPPTTIGALYIGPIKALINDQFDRLTDLLEHAEIPVWAWHGDIVQSRKAQVLKDPRGILQITPESLESLLINKNAELVRLFADLRFVVIDEIHAFMGTERGGQILCQLGRLARLTQNHPRRIGLSATLGDYSLAEAWLQAGTSRPVITPLIQADPRQIHLAVEHFWRSKLLVRAKGDTRDSTFSPDRLHLFHQSQVHKGLIFANGRPETEASIASLRQIAAAKGLPDIYHVHHGSISAGLRETAEQAMRDRTIPAVTAATVTFEMGIDLGQLDRVIQLESPPSVSSFLQRLGRSGRRGNAADMRFICVEEKPTGGELLPDKIPWQLLQCIAIIQLYLEEKWIEPIHPVHYPLSLLYHQTLSILAAGELSPAALAQQILTLAPFRAIELEDFRLLLRHLIELDHVQKTKEGGLMIGLAGERVVGNFKFFATFPDNEEYLVMCEAVELGSIVSPPATGEKIALAGRTWEVLEVDSRKKTLSVKPSLGEASISWHGGSGNTHTRILQRMRRVLTEDTDYRYLQPGAKERLQQVRKLAKRFKLDRQYILPLEDNACCVFPWAGTIAFQTLVRFLRLHCREALKVKGIFGRSPYYLIVHLGKCKLDQLQCELESIAERQLDPADLLRPDEVPNLQKYDEFIPPELLRKAFACDRLDLKELGDILSSK